MRVSGGFHEAQRQCSRYATTVFQSAYALDEERVAVECTAHVILAVHRQVQSGIRAYRTDCPVAVGLGNAVQLPSGLFRRGLCEVQQPGRPVSGVRGDIFPVLRHACRRTLGLCHVFPVGRNLTLGPDTVFLENGLFLFELHNLIVELRFLQQVGISRQESHELGEIHAVILVHSVLVDTAHSNRTVVNLVDEHLLGFQQVKFVSVERLFRSVNHHVHGIVSPELNGVAFAYRTTVALLHVGGAPRYLQMMHRNGPFLGVYSRSQHRGRAEQHPYPATVHVRKKFLSRPFGLGVLDKLDFIGRNPHCHQLVLDVAIDVPLVRLVSGKVAEDELCTTIGI